MYDACNVATRSRQAGSKPVANWVDHNAYDRDRRGRSLENQQQPSANQKDRIRLEVDRLRDHIAETLKVSFTGISADLKISSFDKSDLPKPLEKPR